MTLEATSFGGSLGKEGSAADGHLTGNLATSEGGRTLGETDKMCLLSPKAARQPFSYFIPKQMFMELGLSKQASKMNLEMLLSGSLNKQTRPANPERCKVYYGLLGVLVPEILKARAYRKFTIQRGTIRSVYLCRAGGLVSVYIMEGAQS